MKIFIIASFLGICVYPWPVLAQEIAPDAHSLLIQAKSALLLAQDGESSVWDHFDTWINHSIQLEKEDHPVWAKVRATEVEAVEQWKGYRSGELGAFWWPILMKEPNFSIHLDTLKEEQARAEYRKALYESAFLTMLACFELPEYLRSNPDVPPANYEKFCAFLESKWDKEVAVAGSTITRKELAGALFPEFRNQEYRTILHRWKSLIGSGSVKTEEAPSMDDFFLIALSPEPSEAKSDESWIQAAPLAIWKPLLNHRPSQKERYLLALSQKKVHRVEEADSFLNLDYYSIRIAEGDLEKRKQIFEEFKEFLLQAGDLIPNRIRFEHESRYDFDNRKIIPSLGGGKLEKGSIVKLDFFAQGLLLSDEEKEICSDVEWTKGFLATALESFARASLDGGEVVDEAYVVVTADYPREFRFSTVLQGDTRWAFRSRNAGSHPVAGTRAFGYTETANGEMILYTIGADRLNGIPISVLRSSDDYLATAGYCAAEVYWRLLFDRFKKRLEDRYPVRLGKMGRLTDLTWDDAERQGLWEEEQAGGEFEVKFFAYGRGTEFEDGTTSLAGHAFVGFYFNGEEIGVRGLYAGEGPETGTLRDDEKNVELATLVLSHRFNDHQKFEQAVGVWKEFYFLGANDCVEYTEEIAEILELKIPSRTLNPTPTGYVEKLGELNPSLTVVSKP